MKWVLGGIEIHCDHMDRKHTRDVFLVVVQNHTRHILCEAISQYVCHGSYMVTDKWAGYNNCRS